MALSAKKVRETITDVKLESAYSKPDRVSLICTVGEYRYHAWLLWPSLEFIGSITGAHESETIYRNLVDRSVKSRTTYLTRDTGDGKLVWEAMSKNLPAMATALAADLVVRVREEAEAREQSIKAHKIAEAAPDLFKALLAIVKTSATASRLESDLFAQARAALAKCGEIV